MHLPTTRPIWLPGLNDRKPGVPLALAGGLPPRRLAKEEKRRPASSGNAQEGLTVFRPNGTQRWLLPQLSAITPVYVEQVLRQALAGSHSQLHELFDIMLDTSPELASCVQEFVERVLSKNISFEPYCEDDTEATDSAKEKCRVVSAALRQMHPSPDVDENGFNEFIRDALFARFLGTTVQEVIWTEKDGSPHFLDVDGIGSIRCPRALTWVHHICWAWQDNRLGLRTEALTPQQGFELRSPTKTLPFDDFPSQFIIASSKCKTGTLFGGSILRPLVWWWCASNFSADWMLNLAQLFGIPFRKVVLPNETWGDINQRNAVGAAMQNMGSNGYLVLPEGTQFDFMQAGQSSGQSPQAFMVEFAHRQMRTLILGQTMSGGAGTTGKGGGQAFGTVEEDQKSLRIQAGANFVSQVASQLIGYIVEANYGERTELPRLVFSDSEDISGKVEAYGIAVRAGVLTPSMSDEEMVRKQLKLPPMSAEVIEGWSKSGGIRSPITLQNATAPEAPEEGEETETEEPQEEQEKPEPNKAAAAEPEREPSKLEKRLASAIASDLKPVLKRLEAILAIQDDEVLKAKLEKFLQDFPSLRKSVGTDPAALAVMQDVFSKGLADGLTNSKQRANGGKK